MNKQDILTYCYDFVNKRVTEIELAVRLAEQSIKDDTKSSAGDKYETSREMIQQDLNRYQQQLTLAQQDIATLEKIKTLATSQHVSLGSVVFTNTGAVFFLSISIGAVTVGDKPVFVISAKSPIGEMLLNKKVGDSFPFQGKTQIIEKIL